MTVRSDTMKVIINRFEGEFVAVELEDRRVVKMPRSLVPDGADESTVLSIDINYEATEKLKAGLSRLIKELFK